MPRKEMSAALHPDGTKSGEMCYLHGRFSQITFINMTILRSWREQKIMLKRRFPILNDEDFHFEEGKKDTMLQRLQQKLDKSAAELEALFAELQLY
jgi:hypothetical protein